jgi:predicted transglutaminase-like cysteine proteinase
MFSRLQQLAAVFVVCWAGAAAAAGGAVSNFNASGELAFAPAYGKALPPFGYVDFCARHPADCRPLGGTKAKVQLTDERWQVLRRHQQLRQ